MIIGLTGGIGSGKTTVAKLFETLGCAIYNSDERAKGLYFEPVIKQSIIHLLGNEAYLNDKEINRNYISKKIFADSNLLYQLNNIIHPAVKDDFINFQNRFPSEKLIIKESALLFEAEIYKELEYTILVTAPLEVKIERVMKRNSVLKEDVEKRMLTQWPDEQKIPLANFIIANDGRTALIPQVISIIEQLKANA
ncbi:MAG: dephospho-CoA kinase [Burkholderiales bacterium]|nr:dephospho-CoA kinase [Bacteroidia bacterium]